MVPDELVAVAAMKATVVLPDMTVVTVTTPEDVGRNAAEYEVVVKVDELMGAHCPET